MSYKNKPNNINEEIAKTISFFDIHSTMRDMQKFAETLKSKLKRYSKAFSPTEETPNLATEEVDDDTDEPETETGPGSKDFIEKVQALINSIEANTKVLMELVEWYDTAKVFSKKIKKLSKDRPSMVGGAVKSLGQWLSGITEVKALGFEEISSIASNLPSPEDREKFIKSILNRTKDVPLSALKAILAQIDPSLHETNAYKVLTTEPHTLKDAFENAVNSVGSMFAKLNTATSNIVKYKKLVDDEVTRIEIPEDLDEETVKLILRMIRHRRDHERLPESQQRQEKKRKLPKFDVESLKVVRKYFTKEEYEKLEAVIEYPEYQEFILSYLKYEPEEPEKEPEKEKEEEKPEETRPYLKTNIQLSNKNASREFRALKSFFKAAEAWKPAANESLTPEDLKGTGAKQQFIEFVVDYINTIGPNDQDALKAVFNREGNKQMVMQYIKDNIVMKKPFLQSMKSKVEVEIEKIVSSISGGNEWQIVLGDDLHTIEEVKYRLWTDDEEQVYFGLEKGYKILKPQQFLDMMKKGDIAMMRSKEELDAESAAQAAKEAKEAAAKAEEQQKAEAEKQAQIAAQKAQEAKEAKARADEEAENKAAKEAEAAAKRTKDIAGMSDEDKRLTLDLAELKEKYEEKVANNWDGEHEWDKEPESKHVADSLTKMIEAGSLVIGRGEGEPLVVTSVSWNGEQLVFTRKDRPGTNYELQRAFKRLQFHPKPKSKEKEKPDAKKMFKDAQDIYDKIVQMTQDKNKTRSPEKVPLSTKVATEDGNTVDLTPELVEDAIESLTNVISNYERAVNLYIKGVLKYNEKQADLTMNEDAQTIMKFTAKAWIGDLMKKYGIPKEKQKQVTSQLPRLRDKIIKGKPIRFRAIDKDGKETRDGKEIKWVPINVKTGGLTQQQIKILDLIHGRLEGETTGTGIRGHWDATTENPQDWLYDYIKRKAKQKKASGDNVIPFPSQTQPDKPAPAKPQAAERLQKKLAPLVRDVMRDLNGKEKLRY